MFLEGDELSILLQQEDDFIKNLENECKVFDLTLSEKSLNDLRIGKRTELLVRLQMFKKNASNK
jgi:hypothetical protein